jgi:plastocyanin
MATRNQRLAPKRKRPAPERINVRIVRGQVKCNPLTVRVRPGDTVIWQCKNGALAVSFPTRRNPFTGNGFAEGQKATVRQNARPLKEPYTPRIAVLSQRRAAEKVIGGVIVKRPD